MGSTVSLTETNQLIYATATAITGKLGKKQPKPHTQNMKEPIWKQKIHKEIKRLEEETIRAKAEYQEKRRPPRR